MGARALVVGMVVGLILGPGLAGCRSTDGGGPAGESSHEVGSSIDESDPEVLRADISRHREAAVRLVRRGYRRTGMERRSLLTEALEEIDASRRKLLRLWADAAPGDRAALDREIDLAEEWMEDLRRDVPPDVDAIRDGMRERRSRRATAVR